MRKRPTGGWHPIARFRRWCHLMWQGHIDFFKDGKYHVAEEVTAGKKSDGKVYHWDAIGCSCGRMFYSDFVFPGLKENHTVHELFIFLGKSR